MSRITSTPNVVNGHTNGTNGTHYSNGHTNDNSNNLNYDKLMQDILVEFRKELQTIKAEIVNGNLKKYKNYSKN